MIGFCGLVICVILFLIMWMFLIMVICFLFWRVFNLLIFCWRILKKWVLVFNGMFIYLLLLVCCWWWLYGSVELCVKVDGLGFVLVEEVGDRDIGDFGSELIFVFWFRGWVFVVVGCIISLGFRSWELFDFRWYLVFCLVISFCNVFGL